MQNQELIKAQLQQAKSEIDQKTINFISENGNTTINLKLSQQIISITYNGLIIDNELVAAINQAIATVKSSYEKEMYQVVSGLGIRM